MHRVTRRFHGNSHTQPWIAEIVVIAQYRKQLVAGALVFLKYAGEISFADQLLVSLE